MKSKEPIQQTEKEFYDSLSEREKKVYNSFSPRGKELYREMTPEGRKFQDSETEIDFAKILSEITAEDILEYQQREIRENKELKDAIIKVRGKYDR